MTVSVARFASVVAVACSAVVTLVSPPAQAAWKKITSVDSSTYLTRVGTQDGQIVGVAGLSVEPAGMLYKAKQHIYGSRNRGFQFSEISGLVANDTEPNGPSAVLFFDQQTGWAGVGNKVYRTVNAGKDWDPVVAGSVTHALHFFSATHGVRVGDGGAIGLTTDGGATWQQKVSGTDADLQRMHWTDEQHGWVSGSWHLFNGLATDSIVLRTSDGGQTWQKSAAIDGLGAGPVFFLADGKTGWLAAFKHNDTSEEPDKSNTEARLLKSTDGGATFTDTGLPLVVGKLSTFGFSSDVKTARIDAMFWSDAQHGHLAAGAYLGSASQSSSGGMMSTTQTTTYWKIVDYLTTDGASWTKTDLGTMQSGLNMPPPSDGSLTDAVFSDLYNGWYVANSGIWNTSRDCAKEDDCGTGYRCVQMHCESEEPTSTQTDGGTVVHLPDGGIIVEDDQDLGHVKSGCDCGSASAPMAGLLAIALLALRRRSRNT